MFLGPPTRSLDPLQTLQHKYCAVNFTFLFICHLLPYLYQHTHTHTLLSLSFKVAHSCYRINWCDTMKNIECSKVTNSWIYSLIFSRILTKIYSYYLPTDSCFRIILSCRDTMKKITESILVIPIAGFFTNFLRIWQKL